MGEREGGREGTELAVSLPVVPPHPHGTGACRAALHTHTSAAGTHTKRRAQARIPLPLVGLGRTSFPRSGCVKSSARWVWFS